MSLIIGPYSMPKYTHKQKIMENIQDARESRRIVKTYSWEVAERLPSGSDTSNRSNLLGQVLHDSAGEPDPKSLASPWRKFFEPADSSVVSS